MELEILEKLEKKMGKLLETIDVLREENLRVSSSYDQMNLEIRQMRKQNTELEEENRKLKERLSKTEQASTQREEKIRMRLEALAEKLHFVEALG